MANVTSKLTTDEYSELFELMAEIEKVTNVNCVVYTQEEHELAAQVFLETVVADASAYFATL